jgi:hypothetical protein
MKQRGFGLPLPVATCLISSTARPTAAGFRMKPRPYFLNQASTFASAIAEQAMSGRSGYFFPSCLRVMTLDPLQNFGARRGPDHFETIVD